ncbi:MAG TPA: arginase family protein [Candidatus Dormibacteraeota bacterium]|nr:arginase family protein [Candidatus Dormibacteraeota bacterium]
MNAREWLAAPPGRDPDLAVLGAPLARASISPSQAQLTPAALRAALSRFSTHDGDHNVDLEELAVLDLGDIEGDAGDATAAAAHARLEAAVAEAARRAPVVAVIGGDNSLTRPALCGLAAGGLDDGWGLLTLDCHHDVRPPVDGPRNGTPVRELIELGLPGPRVAQVGMHGFANAADHARWARERGVHTRRAAEVRSAGMTRLLDEVLAVLERNGVRRLHADIDMDVLDRAFAPACPASMPGGLAPHHLQEAAHLLGGDPRVAGVDLCEVDAAADVAGTTVRCMASVLLAFCSGLVQRRRQDRDGVL